MRRHRPAVSLLTIPLLLGALAGSPRAQDDPHAACAAPPSYVPEELLERAVPLRTGVGNSHEAVTTANPQAQAFYDQGLNYLESYVWIEASRSFHQALRLDPKLAMAYLGLSRVQSGLDNPEAAQTVLREGQGARRRGSASASAGASTSASKQLAGDRETSRTPHGFSPTRSRSTTRWPRTSTTRSCGCCAATPRRANASGRGQRGSAASVAFYEQVLRLVPDHATAHHYLVHSYETIGHIDKALEHGEAYARLGAVDPARRPHVGARPAARRTRRRRDRAVPEGRRARARLLRGREDRPRARLAPRPQPRSAGELLRAQGADEECREDVAGIGAAGDRSAPTRPST